MGLTNCQHTSTEALVVTVQNLSENSAGGEDLKTEGSKAKYDDGMEGQ